jgi:hypothetical protein
MNSSLTPPRVSPKAPVNLRNNLPLHPILYQVPAKQRLLDNLPLKVELKVIS